MTVDEANHANTVGSSWRRVVSLLENDHRVTPRQRGFVILAQAQGLIGSTLLVAVPNELTREVLQTQVKEALDDALRDVFSDEIRCAIDVDTDLVPLHVEPEPAAELSLAADPAVELKPQPMLPSTSHEFGRLNPKYVFDTFVIGSSNRFAHAAAVAVAEAPAKAYNPLFIYGDSGLGKTHLLHAIGHYAEGMYPGIRVRYVSSEEFTNDFINSIANNLNQSFQQRYREVDVLLIDDIQFLRGKESTQEAFFHTFNTLHDHNKQVVITSDVAPKLLQGFEARMVSRFEWGLITDVTAPDLETRIAILRKKAEAERIQIPPEVLSVIADKVQSNIRELEGTLIRVTAFASLNRLPVTMDLAQTVLKDLFSFDEEAVVSPSDIISHTAAYFRLTVEDLHGSSRSQTIALARQIAMYLCREMTSMSLPKIGQLFGNRDHTTVMYANKKIEKLIQERRSVYTQVTELTSRIRQQQR